ncbi:hypothetical protein DKX38_022638 [Salix brachista]|uniref:DDT domain-containing protein n=1 Tax=Salix brachista TaxID=2182728 RepID=A0A5N5K035_9ROSI|nr:hypothetical protein DKX38_022638 [Salix brachista]
MSREQPSPSPISLNDADAPLNNADARTQTPPVSRSNRPSRAYESSVQQREQCSGESSKIVTQLVAPPETAQLPRWNLRSMWELASVFRHLLNITVEFSAEEFETALITPNDTLGDIHMPLLKVSAFCFSTSSYGTLPSKYVVRCTVFILKLTEKLEADLKQLHVGSMVSLVTRDVTGDLESMDILYWALQM